MNLSKPKRIALLGGRNQAKRVNQIIIGGFNNSTATE